MTPFDQLVEFLASLSLKLSVWLLVKVLVLIALLIYLAFAGVVVRQVALMTRTLNDDSETTLKFIAWLHLGAAIFVFVLALLIL